MSKKYEIGQNFETSQDIKKMISLSLIQLLKQKNYADNNTRKSNFLYYDYSFKVLANFLFFDTFCAPIFRIILLEKGLYEKTL